MRPSSSTKSGQESSANLYFTGQSPRASDPFTSMTKKDNSGNPNQNRKGSELKIESSNLSYRLTTSYGPLSSRSTKRSKADITPDDLSYFERYTERLQTKDGSKNTSADGGSKKLATGLKNAKSSQNTSHSSVDQPLKSPRTLNEQSSKNLHAAGNKGVHAGVTPEKPHYNTKSKPLLTDSGSKPVAEEHKISKPSAAGLKHDHSAPGLGESNPKSFYFLNDRIEKLKLELDKFDKSQKGKKSPPKTHEKTSGKQSNFSTRPKTDRVPSPGIGYFLSGNPVAEGEDHYQSQGGTPIPRFLNSKQPTDTSIPSMERSLSFTSKQTRIRALLENGDLFGFMQLEESRYVMLSYIKDAMIQLDSKVQNLMESCIDLKAGISQTLYQIARKLTETELNVNALELETLKSSVQNIFERFLELESVKEPSNTANYLVNLRNLKDSTNTLDRDLEYLKRYVEDFNNSLKLGANFSLNDLFAEKKSGAVGGTPSNYVYTLSTSSNSSSHWETALSNDGGHIGVVNDENMLEIYSVAEKRLSQVFDCGDSDKIYSFAISKGCNLLATSSEDRSLKVWELKGKKLLHQFEEAHELPAWCLVISDNHRFLASSSADNSIRIWDLTTGQPYHTFRNILYNPLCRLCFGSDSITLVSSSNDNTLKIWNLEQKALAHAFLNAHEVERNHSNLLASCSADMSIKLWDIQKKANLKTISNAHEDQIYCVAISPGGKYLVSACVDKSLKIWNLTNWRQVHHERATHNGPITSVAWSPDGRSIVTTSKIDKTVKIWNFSHLLQ